MGDVARKSGRDKRIPLDKKPPVGFNTFAQSNAAGRFNFERLLIGRILRKIKWRSGQILPEKLWDSQGEYVEILVDPKSWPGYLISQHREIGCCPNGAKGDSPGQRPGSMIITNEPERAK